MNKKLLTLFFASGLLLAACGDGGNAPEEDVSSSETEGVAEAEEADDVEEVADEDLGEGIDEVHDFNKVFADDEDLYVELVTIMRVSDADLDQEGVGVIFEVENRTDRTLEIQSRSVSINDRMVDDSLPQLSQEVASGKTAEVILSIESYDGSVAIPELENNFEMMLHAFDWDDLDYGKDVEVYVEF